MSQVPTRVLEKSLLATYPLVAGMDEVGRGALAGPATVGVALVDNSTSDAFPSGLNCLAPPAAKTWWSRLNSGWLTAK